MYRLAPMGVTRLSDGLQINRGDENWTVYIEWLASGNLPDPLPVEPADPVPVQIVPQAVSRFQARAALMMAGLLDQVEELVSQANPLSQIAWSDAQTFRRDSPAIISITKQLQLTDEQIDQLFITAGTITA